MKVRTSELIGAALDWAASKADGAGEGWLRRQLTNPNPATRALPAVSTDWSHAGPIIQREEIQMRKVGIITWRASIDLDEGDAMVEEQDGPTPLIAAMRCFVACKLGADVDVPAALLAEAAQQYDETQDCAGDRPGARA